MTDLKFSVKAFAQIDNLSDEIRNAIPKIIAARRAAAERWARELPDPVITSGHEEDINPTTGQLYHAEKSKHYIKNNPSGKGEAIDWRTRDWVEFWAEECRNVLGPEFVVVVHADHLHVQHGHKTLEVK